MSTRNKDFYKFQRFHNPKLILYLFAIFLEPFFISSYFYVVSKYNITISITIGTEDDNNLSINIKHSSVWENYKLYPKEISCNAGEL